MSAYTALIAQGIPQYTAYSQAVYDVQKAWLQLNETIAASRGTFDATIAAFESMANRQNLISEAFYNGANSATDFVKSLVTVGAEANGMIYGLDQAAQKFGYDLPNNIKLTTASAQGLVAAFSGIPSQIKAIASESVSAGEGMLDGVVKAIQAGGDDVNDELDKLEEELGTNFPDSVKTALEKSSLSTAMSDNMTKMIANAQNALG